MPVPPLTSSLNSLKSLYLGAKSVDQEHRLPKQIGRLSVRTVAREKHLDPAVLGQAAWLSDLIINDAGRIMPIALNGDIALRQDTAFRRCNPLRRVSSSDNGHCAVAMGPELVRTAAMGR